MEKNEHRDATRFWAGVIGASALGLVIVIGVVMQMRGGKPELAARGQTARTQAAVRTEGGARPAVQKTPSATKPPVAVKPAVETKSAAGTRTTTAMKPAAAVKPAAVNPGAAVQALTPSERKTSETLWVQERKLESDITRVATAADGRQRVAAAIAKHYSVPEKLVSDLRARKIAHGEITVALALSQQLVKKEKTTQPKAVDRILAMRNSGQGWGAIARSLGLKLGDALDHVEAVDKQVAKLDTGKKSTKG